VQGRIARHHAHQLDDAEHPAQRHQATDDGASDRPPTRYGAGPGATHAVQQVAISIRTRNSRGGTGPLPTSDLQSGRPPA
jgi:hypothetical protein